MDTATPQHPGVRLKGRFLDPLGITPQALADAIQVSARQVDGLVSGRSPMSADLALRLGLFFDVPAEWWLEMQARFDAHDPARLAALRSVVTPFDGLASILVTPDGIRTLERDAAPEGPRSVKVPADLVARLRAQVALEAPRPAREPVVVYFEDGTPCLTGR